MKKIEQLGDKLALSMSFLCAIHCFAVPVLIAILPSFQFLSCANNKNAHLWMMLIILPTSLISLVLGCNKHKKLSFLLIASIGIGILGFSAIWGHDLFGCKNERYVTLLGSAIVSFAHINNFLLCRKAENNQFSSSSSCCP